MVMKTIITACCPNGNLAKIFFIFQQAGLEVESDKTDFALLQGSVLEEDIAGIISGETSFLLPAESRYQKLLDSWAAKFPEAKFLLFYTRAESALACACHQEIEPRQALKNWQAASRQLLNFQRTHRRQAMLLDIDAAIRQPQAFLDICGRFGLTLESLADITAPVEDRLSFEHYLAQQLLTKLPEVQSQQTELEASAQPFDDIPTSELQPLELFNRQSQQLVHQRRLQQQLDATVKKLESAEFASKEKDVQRLSLQDGCDQLTKALDEQVYLNSEQQVQLANMQQIKLELEAFVTEVVQKNEQLALQYHQLQEELGKTILQKEQLEQQVEQDQIIHKEKQTQLDQLTEAHDEQVRLHSQQQSKLEQLQQAHQALDASTKELSQENELLLLQLHQVQEELEQIFLQKQQLEQQAEKDQATQKEKQARIDQLTKACDEQAHLNSEQQVQFTNMQQLNQDLETAIAEVVQKNESLALHLHQIQEELGKTNHQKQKLEQQAEKDQITQREKQAQLDQLTKARDEQAQLYSQQQSKLEQLQQAHQALDASTKELTQENEHLLLQLHQVQEELERIFLQKQQLEQQAEKDQATQKEKQAQLDQLTKTRDEQAKLHSHQQAKLEQLQQAHQALDATHQALDATTKELSQENELLLLQLHQVQEELEKIFLQKQQLERQTHQLVETVKNEKNDELQQVKDELLQKERELEKLHQRDHKLKQSVSWKITSPIRAIAKPFKKLSKDEMKIEEQIKLLRSSELFDAAWYTAANEDVAKDVYDAAEHYVRFGAAEGRDPSPVFSTRRYLEINPDVAETGMNPLAHYAQYGMAEKRCIG
jgi:hypothetical protein